MYNDVIRASFQYSVRNNSIFLLFNSSLESATLFVSVCSKPRMSMFIA